jgi:ribosomal protein S27AE
VTRVGGVQTRTRTVETKTPCPRCGGQLHMRQVGVTVDSGEIVKWADERRFCPRGCLYTADEVVEQ